MAHRTLLRDEKTSEETRNYSRSLLCALVKGIGCTERRNTGYTGTDQTVTRESRAHAGPSGIAQRSQNVVRGCVLRQV